MIIILANPYIILVILYNEAFNSKFLNNELITRYVDRQFIINLSISYYECIWYYKEEYSDKELINRIIIYSYNDRITKKKNDHYIHNSILFNFVKSCLKNIERYINALQIIYN